jgi:hypothetical protein
MPNKFTISNSPTLDNLTNQIKGTLNMTILNTIKTLFTSKPTGFHRSTGMTGQVIASTQLQGKLERVEKLYKKVHGASLGRYKFYQATLPLARQSKSENGGYIQYDAQAVAGKLLDGMEKALRQAVRNDEQEVSLVIDHFRIDNLRELARTSRGKAKKNVA